MKPQFVVVIRNNKPCMAINVQALRDVTLNRSTGVVTVQTATDSVEIEGVSNYAMDNLLKKVRDSYNWIRGDSRVTHQFNGRPNTVVIVNDGDSRTTIIFPRGWTRVVRDESGCTIHNEQGEIQLSSTPLSVDQFNPAMLAGCVLVSEVSE